MRTRVGFLAIVTLYLAVGCGSAERRAAEPVRGPPRSTDEARASSCPEDMVAVECFCVDRYEAPNVRGELPLALKTALEGESWCAERGKRLCSEAEWLRSCEGASARRFPYGNSYRAGACNDSRSWIPVQWSALARWPSQEAIAEASHLYQADRSGTRAECASEEGIYDLIGNVAEWVRRSFPSPSIPYDHVLKGCYWAGCYHNPQPDCAFTNHAHPGSFRTYEAGFRCCADLPSLDCSLKPSSAIRLRTEF